MESIEECIRMESPPSKRLKVESEEDSKSPLSLAELVEFVEADLQQDIATPLYKKKSVRDALERYTGNIKELSRFMFFDSEKKYTRNLIATDNETYALMLLCWNRGKFSPIHDHPCDGCWVKIIQGSVQEIRYKKDKGKLVETDNLVADSGVMYINDSMGLHKVGNPSNEVDAVTLHLYSPPFEKCRLWLDTENADKSSVAVSCYYSEFGEKNEF